MFCCVMVFTELGLVLCMFTEAEKNILLQVYRFQKPRRFRYGLNKKYIRGLDEEAFKKLMDERIIFVIRPYHDKSYEYVLLTRKGRRLVEKELLG